MWNMDLLKGNFNGIVESIWMTCHGLQIINNNNSNNNEIYHITIASGKFPIKKYACGIWIVY